jgi:hypothetical protein
VYDECLPRRCSSKDCQYLNCVTNISDCCDFENAGRRKSNLRKIARSSAQSTKESRGDQDLIPANGIVTCTQACQLPLNLVNVYRRLEKDALLPRPRVTRHSEMQTQLFAFVTRMRGSGIDRKGFQISCGIYCHKGGFCRCTKTIPCGGSREGFLSHRESQLTPRRITGLSGQWGL